jgi:hypothetical protein
MIDILSGLTDSQVRVLKHIRSIEHELGLLSGEYVFGTSESKARPANQKELTTCEMRVVNVRHARCTHYVGRGRAPSGVGLGLGNPFPVEKYGRARSIERFRLWALNRPTVLGKIRRIPRDAVLGCWCKPQACHADVIVEIWKDLHAFDHENGS